MLIWSMVAVLKLRSSCAFTAVPLAASMARPCTSSRRLSAPFSKRATRLEIIDSMLLSLSLTRRMLTIIEQKSARFFRRLWIKPDDGCSVPLASLSGAGRVGKGAWHNIAHTKSHRGAAPTRGEGTHAGTRGHGALPTHHITVKML